MKFTDLPNGSFVYELSPEGYQITPCIAGATTNIPNLWTFDDVDRGGYFRAQYVDFRNDGDGECYGGHYIESDDRRHEVDVAQAVAEKRARLAHAAASMGPLEDAVELDVATDDEIAYLKVWKKYRIAVNRIDVDKAPDIVWPDCPDGTGSPMDPGSVEGL